MAKSDTPRLDLDAPTAPEYDRIQAVEAYVNAVRALEQVSGVFVNESNGLTVYTVYRGDRRQARAAIYDTYQTVMNRFPDLLIDFHTVPSDSAGETLASENAHRVYPD